MLKITRNTVTVLLYCLLLIERAPDVMAAILVFQNNETGTMFVFQTNPVGVQLFPDQSCGSSTLFLYKI